jgi:hypothetical protein
VYEGSFSPTSLPTSVGGGVSNDGYSNRWNLSVVLICVSFMDRDGEHFFMRFFVICISSFQKCLFRSLAHIKIDYLQKIISVIEDTPFQFIGPFYIKVIISTVLIVLSGKLALILAFKER